MTSVKPVEKLMQIYLGTSRLCDC